MTYIDEIWRSLSTDDIGFYTHRTKGKIPSVPGIYAWFLPLKVNSDIESMLYQTKNIFTYDTVSKGSPIVQNFGFNWKPMKVSLEHDTELGSYQAQEKQWSIIKSSGDDTLNNFKQLLTSASFFSRPLYIGLTNNLSRRYSEHVTGKGESSTFHKRFNEHMEEMKKSKIDIDLTMNQLIFVCIHKKGDSGDGNIRYTEDQIKLVEYILKNICQPVFGDR